MTIGDVLAVVFGVIAIALSGWVLLIGFAVVFEKRTELSRQRLENQPLRCLMSGALFGGVAGGLSFSMFVQPNALIRLIGGAGLLSLLALAILGSAGLSQLLGQRIGLPPGDFARWGGLLRGAGVVVLSLLVPVFGWFFLVPLTLVVSIGAGLGAVRQRQISPEKAPATVTPVAPAPVVLRDAMLSSAMPTSMSSSEAAR